MSRNEGKNEGKNQVKAIRTGKTLGDLGSIIIITPNAHSPGTAPSLIFPAYTDVFVNNPSVNSTHLSMGMQFINYLPKITHNGIIKYINIQIIFRFLRILGLMAVLSYMIVILFTWMYANHQGYVYFSAGEPVSLIKYPEWILGFLGIIATASVLRRELDG